MGTKDMSPAGAQAMEEITIFLRLMPPDAKHKVIAQDDIGEWPFAIKLEKLQTKGKDKAKDKSRLSGDDAEEDTEDNAAIDTLTAIAERSEASLLRQLLIFALRIHIRAKGI